VPDLRLALSALRTRNLTSSLLTLAATGPALALVAVAIGTAGATSASAAARPASVASTAHVAVSPAAASASSGARSVIVLDAKPLAAASPPAAGSMDIGPPVHGHTGKAAKRPHRRLTPRQIARSLLRHFGWRQRQFKYLNALWNRESSWNVYAYNPYSGAYGVPQAVPGSKMASAGANWRTSARTQVRWGLRYIRSRYGSPRRAWDHELATGWY
jgi:hypothetical protein